MRKGLTFLLLVSASLITTQARAGLQDEGWIFTPIFGMSGPQLKSLNEGLFRTPIVGQAEITSDLPEDVEGESSYPVQDFHFQNPLNPVSFWWEAGLELRRNFGKKNDLIIGVSSWEVNSSAKNTVKFPLQGSVGNDADYTRRAKFSYTQYYVGLRRYLFNRSSRSNLYFNFTLHDLFDIDYKDKHVFNFTSGPPAGFRRILIYETQATGLLLLQFGMGGEIRLADRFSIGFEGAYALGVKNATLKNVFTKNDFNEGDRLRGYPRPILPDDTARPGFVKYLGEDGKTYHFADFRLDGWRGQIKFNVAF